MLLTLIAIAVVLIAAVLIFAATRPGTLHIQRSIVIGASPQKLFPLLDDFHNWTRWAPQDLGDSTMTRTYSGAARGAGAASEWDSRGSAGKGRMEITESAEFTKVSVKVHFIRSFEAHNLNTFVLEPAGTTTRITWTMEGANPYISKVLSIFVNMDRMMGKHFETGLENLKAIAR